MNKLSVVIATRNEEENISRCLESVKKMLADLPAQAGEIIVVDEYSTDRTCEIAKKYGAKVYFEPHHNIFHITKQKALDYAAGDWILQLDADERVTVELAKEIKRVISMGNEKLENLSTERRENKLFMRHQSLIEQRDGPIGVKTGEIVAFFIPRVNYFLNKPLIHAGVYPDGVIRLIKRGKAHFPQKSVHEQISIDGEVAWLENPLEHHDSPTLKRYFNRLNRYTDLYALELKSKKVSLGLSSFAYYVFTKPLSVFLSLYFRHKGFLDGPRGFLWSIFSAMHFPVAYFKYRTNNYN